MAVRYSGHFLRTRRQAAVQCVVLALALLPLVAWRFTTQPLTAAFALAMLALGPFVIAFQSWQFLAAQEREHSEPTPEMNFVFRFLVNTPLTFGALMLVILGSIR
jgi:uncharacterized membrane protein